ncbi:MAG: response regulator [Deltaproteobacteria bacterium]|nr:response regulator [Deltaproteobacteria bacterium]
MNDQNRDTEKGHILIVDDSPVNVRLLSSILTKQGYRVQSELSGQAALNMISDTPPDLILLDINMPEMNGYEVCEQLKSEAYTADIPIIFISALEDISDKVRAFEVGGVDYIPKPFEFKEVIARVDTHLALRRLQRELRQANEMLEQRVAERTAELVNLNTALERFVPHEFLEFLGKESLVDVKLGDQVQRDMTVMFSDIRDFTAYSEKMTPQDSFNSLNEYLRRVSPVIRRHNGIVDKYLGDGVMALFPKSADDAVRATIAMQDSLDEYNAHRARNKLAPIRIGTGIHTGSLMLGIIGEEQRFQGTVISDAVNLASRLEGMTKMYGVSVIITTNVLINLADPAAYNYRFLDRVRVKGKTEALSVFDVFDSDPETDIELKLMTRTDFEQGIYLYHNKQFNEASEKFTGVLERHPDDKAAQIYRQRAEYYEIHGVPIDWMGVENLSVK